MPYLLCVMQVPETSVNGWVDRERGDNFSEPGADDRRRAGDNRIMLGKQET